MQATLAVESRQLALDVHTLLGELDAARWRAELAETAREHARRIEARVEALCGSLDEGSLRQAVEEVYTVLRTSLPADGARLEEEWAALRVRLQPAYEAMANALADQSIHVPTRRPTNYARNLLHFGGAVIALALVHLLLTPASMALIATGLLLWAWTMELGRRHVPAVNRLLMRILGSFAHPHESYRINSATWYCTALFALSLTGSKLLALVAIAVLGFADPMAAIVGRRYGSVKLVNGRSLQGSLAFLATGWLAALAVTVITRPDIGWAAALTASAAAGAIAAVAELYSLRVDDNLSIPLAAAAGVAVASLAFGFSL